MNAPRKVAASKKAKRPAKNDLAPPAVRTRAWRKKPASTAKTNDPDLFLLPLELRGSAQRSKTKNPRNSLDIVDRVLQLATGDAEQAMEEGKGKIREALNDIDNEFKTLKEELDISRNQVQWLHDELHKEKMFSDSLKAPVHIYGEQTTLIKIHEERDEALRKLYQYKMALENDRLARLDRHYVQFRACNEPSFLGEMERDGLENFFQFLISKWCDEHHLGRFADPNLVEDHMRKAGIINNSLAYIHAPKHLKFDMDMPDGRSGLLLLKAALAKYLCDSFLAKPFFFGEDYRQPTAGDEEQKCNILMDLFDQFRTDGIREGLEWRLLTQEIVEFVAQPTHEFALLHVNEFVSQFQYILKPVTKEGKDGLAELFVSFMRRACYLWQKRTIFHVFDVSELPSHTYNSKDWRVFDVENHWDAGTAKDIHGRPIAVLIRPLIMGTTYDSLGREKDDQMCWMRGQVWVSQNDEQRPE
ncbi:hypothetical protein PT974_05138 [Cladobotryum mycophilum]|uniref:Uncharacterized protein n=1 Tax=Cladobotryum mycophilum TaxID=491253 RepID=A0ABR0SRI8_9HYPO